MRTNTIFFLVLALLATPTLLFSDILLRADFDSHPLGRYADAMGRADFPHPGYVWFHGMNEGRGEIVPGRSGGGNALRMLYPADTYGSNPQAVQIRAALSRTVDTAWASYRVMFEEGFDFVRGGKLPGLCGGQCITGGNVADGYNGWSARVMWRNEGVGEQYMYYGGHSGFHSVLFDAAPPVKRFIPGQWHRINTQIIMNTPGVANGVVRTWVDGELSLDRSDFLFRHTAELSIDLFYISTFFGGSDPSWAPPRDTYITFDDFLVISNPESAPYPQALYTLSETAGRLAPDGSGFTVFADLAASLGQGLNYETRGIAPTTPARSFSAAASGAVQGLTFYDPGIYNVLLNVSDGTMDDSWSRDVIVLDQFDLLCDNRWQSMQLGETLGTGDTLRFFLTIINPDAVIQVGPTTPDFVSNPPTTSSPSNNSRFYGVVRYENGKFRALHGNSPDNFIDDPAASPAIHGAGTYEIVFVFDFAPPSTERTYNVTVYDSSGSRIAGWERVPRRGFAAHVDSYGTWSSIDRAAIAHKEIWEDGLVVGVPPRQTQAVRPAGRQLSVKPRGSNISFTLPTASAAQVEIFNARGVLVRRASTSGTATSLTIPVPASGLYVYRVRSGAGGDVFRGSVVVK